MPDICPDFVFCINIHVSDFASAFITYFLFAAVILHLSLFLRHEYGRGFRARGGSPLSFLSRGYCGCWFRLSPTSVCILDEQISNIRMLFRCNARSLPISLGPKFRDRKRQKRRKKTDDASDKQRRGYPRQDMNSQNQQKSRETPKPAAINSRKSMKRFSSNKNRARRKSRRKASLNKYIIGRNPAAKSINTQARRRWIMRDIREEKRN